ncbi:MAG TPA: class II aldolase/adducin family protein [Casimicrobiaceae bacterium]|nr:class II aldolase/adducin family protein [Casimicrobiaceae bacterium]
MNNPSPSDRPTALIDDLVSANRILYAQKVVDGFGHVSARDPAHPERFFLARSKAPGSVTAEDILVFDLSGEPVEKRGHKLYLERYIHSAIYAARPDVMAVVHSHSPAVIPFGITPVPLQPVFHIGGFLAPTVPVFEIRDAAGPATDLLIRSQELGVALARSLGQRNVVLMRGHGSTAVGNSIPQVVFRAVYTEVNARLQADAMKLGTVTYLTAQEAVAATAMNDAVIGRIWELWKAEADASD